MNFSPELTGIGKYNGEMAQWLAERGHQVRVVTAPPYYPQWRVAEGYRANRWQRSARGFAGGGRLDVWRCPLWVPSRPGGKARLLHLASFALSSLPAILAAALWRPRWIVLVEPPLACAPAAWLAARLSRARAWLHVQDFEVDAAFELGVLGSGRLRALLTRLERVTLRRFDRVSTISSRMLERARVKGARDPVLFPNWVDLDAVRCHPPGASAALRATLGIDARAVVALYSGNMGAKQGLDVLADAARRLQSGALEVTFVFCGAGAGRQALVDACAGLANVRFMELQPVERLDELLAMADIHLLPQRAQAADLVMPSKLLGMLASGRPVVACARLGTELAERVSRCGVVVPPEDGGAMAQAIASLTADPAWRARLGQSGREYAERHLARDRVLERFEQDLATHREGGV